MVKTELTEDRLIRNIIPYWTSYLSFQRKLGLLLVYNIGTT
jgi:hypothetical protein